MRSNQVDGPAAVDAVGIDRVEASAVVHVGHTRYDPLGDISAAQDDPSLIEDLDDIALLKAAFSRGRGMQPNRFILIAVLAADFHGTNLTVPDHIVTLGVHAPAAVIGHAEQRIFLSPFAAQALIMALAAFYPFRIRADAPGRWGSTSEDRWR